MKYGSICSGIEAASVAFGPLGWEAAWFSEIEAFPNAVLAHHYPDVQNHGDMSNLADKILAGEIEAPDIICGGPPCQAFSVAGSRQSLSDKRGNLTLEYIRICDANDAVRSADGREATWILYENVPGLLSVSDNAFGAFLGGLVGRTAPIPEPADGWTGAGVVDGPTRCAAWRILDAQHFGLAQRRKRVFVLARGGAGRWAVADALLPIIEGSGWHPAPSRGKGKGAAQDASKSIGIGSWWDGGDTAGTLTCNNAGGEQRMPDKDNFGAVLVRMREGKEGGGKGPLVSEDQSLTLATGNDQVLAYRWQNETDGIVPDEVASTLRANGTTTDERTTGAYVQQASMQVRRLTPVECSRLQGFPDEYLTQVSFRGKCPPADGVMYKALGNSWAVPCARYIAERIKAVSKQ